MTAAAAAVSGALTVGARSHNVASARNTSEPLVVDAQTVVVDLSDANSTIAGGFLSGRVVPAAVQARYDADLAGAGHALAASSPRAGTDSDVTDIEQTLAVELPRYSAIVATAETDNRQGQPVGAAYLSEANHLMSSVLLPAASNLYALERQRLAADAARATAWSGETTTLGFLALLLGLLLVMQVGVARRFRRVFAPGGLLATAAVVAVAVWMVVALASEGQAVTRADHVGSAPLDVFTQARILDGRARADDQLTLVTRDADTITQSNGHTIEVDQADYNRVASQLAALVSRPGSGWSAAEAADSRQAVDGWQNYQQDHVRVRADDATGQLAAAISLDQASSSDDAARLDHTLSQGVSTAVTAFSRSAGTAAGDVAGLMWGSVALMVMVAAGAVAAALPRIREYR
jgi:hypothetical protein